MPADRMLITGGTLLQLSEGARPRTADVLIENGMIGRIDDAIDTDAEVIDAHGCLVLPGLVDAHRHTWQTALRGVAHNWSLKDYIRAVRLQASRHYRPEDMYIGNYAGMLEAIDAGVTTVLDFCHNINSPEHAEAAVSGTRASGIRSVFALGLNDAAEAGAVLGTLDERIRHARDFRAAQFPGDGDRVTFGICLSDVPVAGLDRMSQEVRLARELGGRLTLHGNCVMYPGSGADVATLNSAGLLGEDLVWVHMSLTSVADLRLVVESGGSIACTPETEMQMGMGHPVFGRHMEAGGRPALGVDVVSSNSGDLFSQMRLALQTQRMLNNDVDLAREHAPDHIEPKTEDALLAATRWGAQALGLESRIGTLEVGKAADVIMVRADALNMLPVNDPVGSLVLHAHPGNVDTVLVGGRILKRHGRLLGDMSRVVSLLQESHDHLLSEINSSGGLIPRPPVAFPW